MCTKVLHCEKTYLPTMVLMVSRPKAPSTADMWPSHQASRLGLQSRDWSEHRPVLCEGSVAATAASVAMGDRSS